MNQISLTSFGVLTFDCQRHPPSSDQTKEIKLNLRYSANFDQQSTRQFMIVFRLELNHPGQFYIQTTYAAWFQTNSPIEASFRSSDFVSINAPAIAYPYLRSFISTFTTNAGLQVAILPTVNFVEARSSMMTQLEVGEEE